MDKRLRLTDKQRDILWRYVDILREMYKEGIKGIYRPMEDIFFFNGKDVADWGFSEDVKDADDVISLDDIDLFLSYPPFGLVLTYQDDDTFAVTYKSKE